jgi:NADH:ubiquinone oxidoreductase subunit 3 (subunit A)
MDATYLAIAVFLAIALIEPVSIFLTSIAIRRREPSNQVKANNYESAELSSGKRLSIMNEYLPYFPMFLTYEIIIAIMLIWVLFARGLSLYFDSVFFGLFAFGFIMELSIIKIAKSGEE